MRRWIARVAAFYPDAWRRRYGVEFHALLEDVDPGWRELLDVLRGAIIMQITARPSYFKIAGAMAVLGAAIALVASFGWPGRYVSSAVVRGDKHAAEQLQRIQQEILSRSSLAEMIQRPSLDLYRAERSREPMEDIIEQMRRDIRIQWAGGPAPTLNISFNYPDREKAQAVMRDLVTKFLEGNVAMNRNRVRTWHTMWPLSEPPAGPAVEVLDPASLPGQPARPNRFVFVGWGLGAGLVLGLLAALAMRQPKWTLRLAGFTGAGLALGIAAVYLIPGVYTSTAVMRITPAEVPDRLRAAVEPTPPAERLQQLQQQVLSRSILQKIIQKPSLDLYSKQRRQMPLEDVIEKMRQDIRIHKVTLPGAPAGVNPVFGISFSYQDPEKAQAVVRALVTQFVEQYVLEERARIQGAPVSDEVLNVFEYKLGENLEVLDPASLPQAPVAPNRVVITAGGIACGILAWAMLWWLRARRAQVGQPA